MPTIDCSHSLDGGTPVYPGDPPVRLEPAATMADDGYRVTELALGSHAGTHVDAPSHLLADGPTLDALDVDRFAFEARLVDLTGFGPRDPIGPDQLPEPDYVAPAVDLLVCHTGWDDHWGSDRYRDHPYLTPAAADHCATAGWSVALDAPSPDPSPTADATAAEPAPDEPDGFPAHEAILGAELLLVENLTNLDAVSTDRFTLQAYPLAIVDADGAPVRAVAQWNG